MPGRSPAGTHARVDALTKITQLEQQLAKLQFRQDHLELRAPQAGVVKELATTTISAVVQPETVLLSPVQRVKGEAAKERSMRATATAAQAMITGCS